MERAVPVHAGRAGHEQGLSLYTAVPVQVRGSVTGAVFAQVRGACRCKKAETAPTRGQPLPVAEGQTLSPAQGLPNKNLPQYMCIWNVGCLSDLTIK